jgi:prepilin-type processing-associated H-X9-DG protein
MIDRRGFDMHKITLLACSLAIFILGVLALSAPADDPPPITRKELKTASNNMKQFGLAFQNSHDAYDRLPGNLFDKDGKPLLSWRVAILPFIEEGNLYGQFKLDEPWDSKNNKKLIEKMPKLYQPLRVGAKPGETYYQMFEGAWDQLTKKEVNITLASIAVLNGTSNTGLVFEAGEPVIWSKPADMPFDKKKPLPKLGGMFNAEFHVAFCDGHVQLLDKDVDEEAMKCMIDWKNTTVFDLNKRKK